MYIVESETGRVIFRRRRDAFAAARKAARTHGWATWEDALRIEPNITFRMERGHAVICRCTAESRLLRAIFGEDHPDACTPAKHDADNG